MPWKVIEAEREQQADCARIDAAVALAQQRIAALKAGPLHPDEAFKQWPNVRDQIVLLLRDVRRNMLARANKAKGMRKEFIEAFFQEYDSISDNSGLLAGYTSFLADIPTKGLLDHLRYLIRMDDRVRVHAIRVVFEARADRHAYASVFEETVADWALTNFGADLGDRLARICRLAEEADAKIASLLSDRRNPLPAPLPRPECNTQALSGELTVTPQLSTPDVSVVPADVAEADLGTVAADVAGEEKDGCSSSIIPSGEGGDLYAERSHDPISPGFPQPLEALFGAIDIALGQGGALATSQPPRCAVK